MPKDYFKEMRIKHDEEDNCNGYLTWHPLPISCPPLHDGDYAGAILKHKNTCLWYVLLILKTILFSDSLVEDDFSLICIKCRTGCWLFSGFSPAAVFAFSLSSLSEPFYLQEPSLWVWLDHWQIIHHRGKSWWRNNLIFTQMYKILWVKNQYSKSVS